MATLIVDDIAAFKQCRLRRNKLAATPAQLSLLGANGSIINAIIAGLQAGQGKVIIALIQAIVAAFGAATPKPATA